MSNNYTWVIDSLDCTPSLNGQTNVVSNVYWRVIGTDGTHTSAIYGIQPLTYKEGSPFTAYSALTKDTVIGWVQTAMGVDRIALIQTTLNNMINSLASSTVVQTPLPWNN